MDIAYLLKIGDEDVLNSINNENIGAYQKTKYNKLILYESCKINKVKFMQWYMKKNKNDIKKSHFNKAFVVCCQNNNINGTKMFIINDRKLDMLKYKDCKGLRAACRVGCLEIVKFYISRSKEIGLFSVTKEFQDACENGHLLIAQTLIEEYPDTPVHFPRYTCIAYKETEDEYAFRFACIRGHLTVCEWLFEKYPNIDYRIGNDDAFRWACYNGHRDVCNWFITSFATKTNYAVIYADLIAHSFK